MTVIHGRESIQLLACDRSSRIFTIVLPVRSAKGG
jgi:hypothetical protein